MHTLIFFKSHANIVQTVKIRYKIKIAFRDFWSGFYGVLQRCCPHNIQEKPLFHSNKATVGVEERLFCMAIEAVLGV